MYVLLFSMKNLLLILILFIFNFASLNYKFYSKNIIVIYQNKINICYQKFFISTL